LPLSPNTRLGPYLIVGSLGSGGMGEVYRARDSRLGRDVALKVLPQDLRADPEFSARFAREARTLSQLSHPNICTLHDVGRDGDVEYLVMEFIEGETLHARLQRGALPVRDVLDHADQIASALVEAHRAGLVHRDLKPANLMLTNRGIKLLDFGLARPAQPADTQASPEEAGDAPTMAAPLTEQGAILGTFDYMAPEQLEGREADARTDLFAFGCVLYQMATGEPPFPGRDIVARLGAMVGGGPLAPSRRNRAIPKGLDAIVARCLESSPEDRPATAAEVVEALGALRRWPREEGVQELLRLCEASLFLEEGRDSWSAFELAAEIEKLAPDDPIVRRLQPSFASEVSITSEPEGAEVFAAFYGDPPGEEIGLGRTPLCGIHLPRGLTRLRLERPGHRVVHDLLWTLGQNMDNATIEGELTWHYSLRPEGELPEGMEEVPPGGFTLYMPGLDHLGAEPTGAFLLDRHPVTNREYKRFVDDGGYEREEFWRETFLEEGVELGRTEAMSRMVDTVGRPGPAGWMMGEYPAGDDEHPVSGVCWYEAAAYAAWAGKTLPTIFHWNRVAMPICSALIAPPANFSGRGTVPVGQTRSFNRFGVHDLAGNVREWVLNSVDPPARRFILGGGWNDPGYAFVDAYAQPAFDRSATNGFRCMRAIEPDPNAAQLERSIPLPFRDFRSEEPVPDQVFDHFRRQFQYDRMPLDTTLVAEEELPTGPWRTYEIDAAYGGERMRVHVFLPSRGEPPYQTVVMFPGSLALHNRVFNHAESQRLDFLVRGGRALVLPIYKGTFERGGALTSDYPEETTLYKDHLVMWGKDLSRAVDFVESCEGLDAERLAYFGLSWGGALGAILPAIEPRIRVNVLYVAGFCFQRALPEADQINYVTRVTQPTLMLNGELDFFFPVESSQRPMFELLGTPEEHKKRLTYARGHTVPRAELVRESVGWLDSYLGAVL
jgi:serine/threonine protein kinase/pimeloyl-ACP methyl ester carboxylesterase